MSSISMAPYPCYRSSGKEWFTELPDHWKGSALGFECSVKARLGWRGLKAEEYVDRGYIFLATPNIKGSSIDFDDVNFITKERYEESPEIMLEVGDVLVTKDGSTTGITNLVSHLPSPATVNSSIAVLRSLGELKSGYLFWFFTSDYVQNIINRMRGGMGVPHLFQSDLRKFFISVPPPGEQTQIAKFLDYETAKIDALIEKQQQLIALLKEKRQGVISHAVTKGLNPDAPMRDSGVEWLGEVPSHWEVYPLGALFRMKHGYPFDSSRFDDSGDLILMTPGNFNERGGFRDKIPEKFYRGSDFPKEFVLKTGELLVALTEQGPGLLGSALFVPAEGTYLHNQRLGLVQELRKERVNARYLFHLFNSGRYRAEIGSHVTGSTVRHTSPKKIRSVKVWLPTLGEQVQIARFLDGRLVKFDALEAKAEETILLLQERRTALISAAVTGKIDVRAWKPPASDSSSTAEAS